MNGNRIPLRMFGLLYWTHQPSSRGRGAPRPEKRMPRRKTPFRRV